MRCKTGTARASLQTRGAAMRHGRTFLRHDLRAAARAVLNRGMPMSPFRCATYLAVWALLVSISFAAHASGELDPAFGNSGTVELIDIAGKGYGIARDAQGNLFVAGIVGNPGSQDFSVVKLDAFGRPAQNFGDGGRATIDLGGDDVAYSVAINAGGDVFLGGRHEDRDRDRPRLRGRQARRGRSARRLVRATTARRSSTSVPATTTTASPFACCRTDRSSSPARPIIRRPTCATTSRLRNLIFRAIWTAHSVMTAGRNSKSAAATITVTRLRRTRTATSMSQARHSRTRRASARSV